jgi:O-Antigen ligase
MTAARGIGGATRPAWPLAGLAAAGGALALAAASVLGQPGLLVPLAVLAMALPLARPLLGLAILVAVVVVCEVRDASLLPALEAVYSPIAGPVAAVDLLLALVAAGTALELSRRGLPVLAPGRLTLPLALLALALAGGVVTGYARGAGPVDILYAGRYVAYVIVVPVLVVNLIRTRRQVVAALAFGAALAVGKAVLGVLTVASGRGRVVDGATITFYEPVANWIMVVCLLCLLAAVLHGLRDRLPLWALLGAPLMVASLALSLRRSFWIGVVFGAGLVLVLGASPLARRLLAPAVVIVVAAGWALWSLGFQADGRLATRAESLKPSRIEASAEERYRFAERANALAEVRAHPIAGLGLAVPWGSAARPLPVEHENGRQYVHTVSLWYWLRLGIVGLVAYVALMAAAVAMAWRVWRDDPDALMRAAGLGGACSLLALAVIETTGSFTGVEPRFTITLAAMLGLIAAAYRLRHPASA